MAKKKNISTEGPIKRTQVAYGTPEYEKAYKEGRIASYDATTGMYVMQELPTHTVEGKKVDSLDGFKNINWGKEAVNVLDIGTDLMQLGNFVPHPVGQAIGKIGNIAGAAIDGYQAIDSAIDGNYSDAAINAASVGVSGLLGMNTFRRNSKWINPSGPRTNYINLMNQVRNQSKSQLNTNRALLGTIGAETLYDTFGDIPEQEQYNLGGTFQDPTPNQGLKASTPNPLVSLLKADKYKKQFMDIWNSDKDILAFRDSFKKNFNEDPDPFDKESKYDYVGAVLSGDRPQIHLEDGLYHWSSRFKGDDHPNRFVKGVDTKQYALGGFFGQGLNAGTGAGMMGMAGGMLGGLIPTNKANGNVSIGGSVAGGALQGAASGAAMGPIGMAVMGGIGGITSLLQAKKLQEQQEKAQLQEQNQTSRSTLANMQYGVANSSNLPMAMGGQLNPMDQTPIGDFSNFQAGGTHEQNPLGGIPQGYNAQGQLRTTEQHESIFKFSEGKYVFSNRIKYE